MKKETRGRKPLPKGIRKSERVSLRMTLKDKVSLLKRYGSVQKFFDLSLENEK